MGKCYMPGCKDRKKCDIYKRAACVWKVTSPEAGRLIQELRAKRDKDNGGKGKKKRRKKQKKQQERPASAKCECGRGTVPAWYLDRGMQLCTYCRILWAGNTRYDWRAAIERKA